MRIGELSRAAGVDVETIRFYEKSGVLPRAERQANGYRSYGPAHLERLAFVRHCRALDIPLADVQRLLAFLDRPGEDCGDIDQLVATHLVRVRARLASMLALEQQLTALSRACATDSHTVAECGILQELVAAAHGEACACHALAEAVPAAAAPAMPRAAAPSVSPPAARAPARRRKQP
ncbi:Cd(II)/Pb(II)-responsive transcriptional regulator [Imbroritus primus]|uniref:Cd(II)/Pb(II)-responsive transcriptional regulator n=1 Tax=Imbroritus primus TaxID=3058603 RepID=UPI003D160DEC